MRYEGVDQRLISERAEMLAREHGDAPGVRLLVDRIRISPFYGNVRRAVEIGWEAWKRAGDAADAQMLLIGPFGLVLWFAGDYAAARRLLEPRVRLEQPPRTRAWTLAVLSLTASAERDTEQAERLAREAMAVVEELDGQDASEFTDVYLVVAEALRLRGKLDEAGRHLAHALAAEAERPGSIGYAMALTFDAQLALAQHDRRRARTSAQRARAILDQYPDVGTLGERLTAVEDAIEHRGSQDLLGSQPTRAELRLLALLPSGLTLEAIASERLHVSINTVTSHAQRLYRRLGVKTRAEAVTAASERGLL
jgi:LuxR family maltose regulon positive regulatory protein